MSDLTAYFKSGIKPVHKFKIGVEWEKIGVYQDSFEAIPYSGQRGVQAIFQHLVRRYRWRPERSEGRLVALTKGASSITLEPGGQIELSGRPAKSLNENAAELCRHLHEIRAVSEPLGILWLGVGIQPLSSVGKIEWTPKPRYRLMKNELQRKGSQTFLMMKQTASIQISLDFKSEADALEKLRLGFRLAPLLTAMYANSPISGGRLNGFLSKRADIWLHTDPSRSGIIREIFRPCAKFEDYVEYALNVPMLFLIRNKKWIGVKNLTFGKFLKTGWRALRPQPGDWELHLTSIFTDCRLKTYLEIRAIDCQRTDLALSAPALIKGLFYNKRAFSAACQLLNEIDCDEILELKKKAALLGLKASLNGKKLLTFAEEIVSISHRGLAKNERRYLRPLERQIFEKKRSPAEDLIHHTQKIGLESLQSLSL